MTPASPMPEPRETPTMSDETDPYFVLDFCRAAIEDAITLEDGLDAGTGERVLAMIAAAMTSRERASRAWWQGLALRYAVYLTRDEIEEARAGWERVHQPTVGELQDTLRDHTSPIVHWRLPFPADDACTPDCPACREARP